METRQTTAPAPIQRDKHPGIDLSAYMAGLGYATGVLISGPVYFSETVRSGGPVTYALAGAFLIFIAAVLLIQRHMRFSLRASTFGKPQHLSTGGVFRYSRNPIYVAFFVPLLSIALVSVIASAAALVVYIVAMNLTVIRNEERDLTEKFGEEYRRYKASVPRWLFW